MNKVIIRNFCKAMAQDVFVPIHYPLEADRRHAGQKNRDHVRDGQDDSEALLCLLCMGERPFCLGHGSNGRHEKNRATVLVVDFWKEMDTNQGPKGLEGSQNSQQEHREEAKTVGYLVVVVVVDQP